MDNYLKLSSLSSPLKEGIISLELSDPFNELISNSSLPSSLKTLLIKSKSFTKGFSDDFSLKNIETLVLPVNYIKEEYLPLRKSSSSLKNINFGYSWNPKNIFSLPSSIENVTFGGMFEDIPNFLNTENTYKFLSKLALGGSFNKPITPSENIFIGKSKNIRELRLSNHFNNILDLSESNITSIIFSSNFVRSDFKLSPHTQNIVFGTAFNNDFDISPYKHLESIIFRKDFKKRLMNKENKEKESFFLSSLDLSKIDPSFPIYNFSIDENIKVGNLRLNEDQFFLLEIYMEKNNLDNNEIKIPDIIKCSHNIIITKNEKDIIKVSAQDFSKFEETNEVSDEKINININEKEIKKLIDTVKNDPALFSLIVEDKSKNIHFYNVDKRYYSNSSIHALYNGEYSESFKYIKEENEKVYNVKDFKPFDFFVSSIYNVYINRNLRGLELDLSDSEVADDTPSSSPYTFYMDPVVLNLIVNKIKKLFLYKIPKTKDYLIVRRSLTHDFFDKVGVKTDEDGIPFVCQLPITLVESGLMSTSLYIHPSFTYNQRRKNLDPSSKTKSWLMVLIIPPGVPVFDTANNFNNKAEKEVLLPPNLEYVITDILPDFKIHSKEVYKQIFLNKFTLWDNEYKRRIENDRKELNDTINVFFAYIKRI